jgi:peptide/nickel transport system substrate-binding protein
MTHIRWQALIALVGIIFLGILLAYLAFSFSTVAQADYGGTYIEGLAGEPNTVNPLFDQFNPVDRDIAALLFNGLTRADEAGVIQPDLAKKWDISPDGLIYTFTLRTDVQWSDGAPLSADDVLYTIQTIQSSDYNGLSYVSDLWSTVAITKVNAAAVRFQLSQPFAPFLDFTTIGVLPSHLLQDTSPGDLAQSPFNRAPVGTGPFVLDELTIDHATFSPNPRFFGARPYLGNLEFKFYPDSESLIAAYERGEIEGISQVTPDSIVQARTMNSLTLYSVHAAGSSLVFLNLNRPQFQQKEVRQALLYAIDRQKIIDDILHGQGILGSGPILPNSWAFDSTLKKYSYDLAKAQSLLDAAGWRDSNSDGVREKGKDTLTFTLMTNSEDPTRGQIAQQLASDWQRLGAKVDVKVIPSATLVSDALRPRDFDAVLYGFSELPPDPDPYPLWHSTQTPDKSDAGQNYSGWSNTTVDDILQEARRVNDPTRRTTLYRQFQTLFMDELPALILYYPVYTYAVDNRLHGVQLGPLLDPSDRFRNISQWYIKTRRVIFSESNRGGN